MTMTPQDRLWAAHRAAREGRYEEALRELVWIHEHALEEDRAMYGVRLSYALDYWVQLGRRYPPAREALAAVRERKSQALLRGEGDFHLFHDVIAIDETMEAFQATRELYLALMDRQPAFAANHVALALPAIARAGDAGLVRRVRPDPETELRQQAERMRQVIRTLKQFHYSAMPMHRLQAGSYAHAVRRVTGISTLIGEHEEARRLQALALDLVQDPSLRRAVRIELAGQAMPHGFGKRRRWRELRRGRRRAA